jgi:hypothetical protein
VTETLVIPSRFRGPADSANGGYASARVAELAGWNAEVTLRAPPPLERPLRVERDGGTVRVLEGDTLVAQAAPLVLELETPGPISFEEAVEASDAYRETAPHPFPSCFVCGPGRVPGDGLRLRPGPRRDGLAAAPWVPDPSLAGAGGLVATAFHWAALDCPGAFAVNREHERGLSVLGRFAARVVEPVAGGEPAAVVGWPLGEDGRKLYAGTALFAGGRLRAFARATWIVLPTAGSA